MAEATSRAMDSERLASALRNYQVYPSPPSRIGSGADEAAPAAPPNGWRDWRSYAGPHVAQGLENVRDVAGQAVNYLGFPADMKDGYEDLQDAGAAFRRGDIGTGLGHTAYAAVAPLGMMIPGTIRGLRQATEAAVDPVRAKLAKALDIDPSAARTTDSMRAEAAVPGATDLVPGPLKVLKKGLGPAIKDSAVGGISKGASGVGGPPPPSGVPAYGRVPQLPMQYPPTAPPAWTVFKDTGKEGFSKVNSPEALRIQTQVAKAQRDIDAGNYIPYYDVSKRADVDPSNYPFSSVDTLSGARPAKQATIDKYVAMADTPHARANLINAYHEGKNIPNSDRFYWMKQLEDSFIKEYGPVKGREMFDKKFATSMAATTGGASPKENFRNAMYGNYLRENGLPYPKNAYELPFPIGGRRVQGNIDMHGKILDEGSVDPVTNPKRYNFRGNFLGQTKGTIDEQMSGLFVPGLLSPPGSSYGIFEDVLNDVARGVKKDTRNFQEVGWAGTKKMKDGKNYPGSTPMVGEVNEAIERTSRVTGLSPENVVKWGLVRSKIPIFSAAPVGAGLGAALSSMGGRTESEGGI